jgi:predicted RNase H-like HicB family nuclease
MLYYVAVVRGDEAGGYEIAFPDFPGVSASHPQLDKALSQAEINLFRHVSALRADDRKVPLPRSVDEILADASAADMLREGAITVVPLLPSPADDEIEINPLHRRQPGNPLLRYLDASPSPL